MDKSCYVNLSWSNSTDRIYFNSFGNWSVGGGLVLNKDFMDEDGIIHTADNVGTLAGKTLAPVVLIVGTSRARIWEF